MNVFAFRDQLIQDYADYINSYILIQDQRIRDKVQQELNGGALWPDPLIQLNPSFEPGPWIDELVDQKVLHDECRRIFRRNKDRPDHQNYGSPLRLHRHQHEAILTAQGRHNYVLTTGTGSGKSLAYIIPIVDHVLKRGSGRGVQAIVVYPMNALANSQFGELTKFLSLGYPEGKGPVTFARYTGQESDEARQRIMAHPPDIILTNYVMLELILTRTVEGQLIRAAQGLRFLVLDELHTYRGRQGADVALLVRRVRDRLAAHELQCVGTSATLAGAGSYDEQRAEVARVASQLFGAPVQAEHVIGETIRRTTPPRDPGDLSFIQALTARVADPARRPPAAYDAFVNDPLSIWIESMFGVHPDASGTRLNRATPLSINGPDGAARKLSQATRLPEPHCAEAMQAGLLGGYACQPHPDTGFTPFAFRLHQFISRGDAVYASLEPEEQRHITLNGQQFVPGSRDKLLLPVAFCRECGQAYYSVWMARDTLAGHSAFTPRRLNDMSSENGQTAGFLYRSGANPWPENEVEAIERYPEDWLEETRTGLRVRHNRRDAVPQPVRVGPDGGEHADGLACHFVPAPFRFCLCCGISYGGRQVSDFAKLASLSSEGRSTATTILSLNAIRGLRGSDLPPAARKLLSFTDDRQDASLQAGHFNDFVEVGLLRAALFRAAASAGAKGLRHDELADRVFDALGLPIELYAVDPQVRFQARAETERALRNVLGYRLYRDLKRGWRITAPNLEQCGLLEIRYLSLDEVCAAEDVWASSHAALATARPETRQRVARVLLDFMRRELAVKVAYLDQRSQEAIQQQSSQRLVSPWAMDENEPMEHAAVLYPRPVAERDYGGDVYLSPRGGFGQFLRRRATFPDSSARLSTGETDAIIRQLLEGLRQAGLVEIVRQPRNPAEAPGYQLPASMLMWVAGDGSRAYHDPISVPNEPESGGRTNPFFVEFYRTVAASLQGIEAHEHTAQVPSADRELREQQFREGRLPILYCSPTMELGVDISDLNVVNLRNVPPTPANYAQRSGRAGRSGQPALVFSYCSTGSSHDQYFFKRPERMVAGAVTPPRLDLSNEELVRGHVHAIWLAETGMSLGKSLKDLLDLSGEDPSLALLPSIKADVADAGARRRARLRAEAVLATLQPDLGRSDWHSDRWLDEVFAHIEGRFDQACDRWRKLYRSALMQARAQDRIIRDASRSAEDKAQAERLRREAESQLKLLTEVENVAQSDFYSYRYFASEGFLPGYSFPRLPISAFIPARRTRQHDEFLSRPRFLAVSEFGPRAIVYHEGSRYLINKVILPIAPATGDGAALSTQRVKRCEACGYLHPISAGDGPDQCERCGAPMTRQLRQLLRMENVSTKRRDKINSDEEERLKLGYELISGVRFTEHGGRPSCRAASVERGGVTLATLTYGQGATLWRINLGWQRRANRDQLGFLLDVERGYWARNEDDAGDPDDPSSARNERVLPCVEDQRNALLLEIHSHPPGADLRPLLASLQAALKSAIQVQYQLEDNELAAEPLPAPDERRLILLYESAEGGAGVLRRLLDDPQALARVAREALRICHFDPDTGADLRHAPRAKEDCEAACYDCLMSYYNQREHRLLDRQCIRDLLLDLSRAEVRAAPAQLSRAEHLAELMRLCGSELEREWLRFLEQHNLRLPSRAQVLMPECGTRPDFVYDEQKMVVYVDGPHHLYPERMHRDQAQQECLEDRGWFVLRFPDKSQWAEIASHGVTTPSTVI